MQTVRLFLASRPVVSTIVALVIALALAACNQGGGAGPGY
jgi:hypothetical protein